MGEEITLREEKIFYEPSAVVDDIEQRIASATGPQIELSPFTNISNQDARILETGKPDEETQLGVLMLGNTGLEMPNGTYVSAEIVENALNNYLKAVKKQKPPIPPTLPPISPDNSGGVCSNTEVTVFIILFILSSNASFISC